MKHYKFTLDVIIVFLASSLLINNLVMAGDCGSKEGKLNQVSKIFVIPNYFPPESLIVSNLVTMPGGPNSCHILFGRANLSSACKAHDVCYGIQGASKGQCDADLLQDWESRCKSQYRNRYTKVLNKRVAYLDNPARSACRTVCVEFVRLMSEAQTVNEAGFCPSCKAFDAAQQ